MDGEIAGPVLLNEPRHPLKLHTTKLQTQQTFVLIFLRLERELPYSKTEIKVKGEK